MTTIAATISEKIVAIENCNKSDNVQWLDNHTDALHRILKGAPSGSGFDAGTTLDDDSFRDKLIFSTSFHHMNDVGYYVGWTEHKVVVTPSFTGINIKVTGKDRNGIKCYIADTFYDWLTSEYK